MVWAAFERLWSLPKNPPQKTEMLRTTKAKKERKVWREHKADCARHSTT